MDSVVYMHVSNNIEHALALRPYLKHLLRDSLELFNYP